MGGGFGGLGAEPQKLNSFTYLVVNVAFNFAHNFAIFRQREGDRLVRPSLQSAIRNSKRLL